MLLQISDELDSSYLRYFLDLILSIQYFIFSGARALKAIVETTLLDAMFEIPGSDIFHVKVTRGLVNCKPLYDKVTTNNAEDTTVR